MKKMLLTLLPVVYLLANPVLADTPSLANFATTQAALHANAQKLGISKEQYAKAMFKHERFMAKLVASEEYLSCI